MFERHFSATGRDTVDLLSYSVERHVADGFYIHRYLPAVLEAGVINVEGQVVFSDLLKVLLGLGCGYLQEYPYSGFDSDVLKNRSDVCPMKLAFLDHLAQVT